MQQSKLDSKKPMEQNREDDKLRGPTQKSPESCGTRSYVQLRVKLTTRAHMQRGKDLEDSGTDVGQRRQATGSGWAQAGRPRPVGPGRPSNPFQGPVTSPFDLAAIRAISSPRVESHASINSSSATEEQRREGCHPREERVELVD
jgi:hypothetical protein